MPMEWPEAGREQTSRRHYEPETGRANAHIEATQIKPGRSIVDHDQQSVHAPIVSFMPVAALPMDAVVFSIEGSPLSPALIGPVGAGERCGDWLCVWPKRCCCR